MAPITELSHLMNPLASSMQLETSSSQLDGVPRDLEESVRYQTALLLQAAGMLLHLPQELIVQSIVIQQRFWIGPDGGSMLEHNPADVAAAALYLTAKPSGNPVSPRQLLTVFAYLATIRPDYEPTKQDVQLSAHLSEGDYETKRSNLYEIESRILRVLGFQTHVAVPHTLCINYLQTLDAFQSPDGGPLAKRAFALLNGAALSPQLLYLTHQPSAMAASSIYLAARELAINLPETEWWEVFDVDREELGFLVVALISSEGFAEEEKVKWGTKKVPLSVEHLQAEIERRRMLESGE